MNKFVRRLGAGVLAAAVFVSGVGAAIAQTTSPNGDACKTGGALFGFFNGVLTTPRTADDASLLFEARYKNTIRNGDDIRFEAFYNKSEGFNDFVETFDQRLKEHEGILAGRFELFFEALSGGGSWWNTIVETVPALGQVFNSFTQWYLAAVPRMLTQMLGNPSTAATLSELRGRVDGGVLEGRRMLFVAHSQGNLFANIMKDYAASKMPADAVKVVHIAPASPVLNGSHVLADKDLVINALAAVGAVGPVTDTIPPALYRTPGLNGKLDISGHGLLEIYLNPAYTTAEKIDALIRDAFGTLVAPPVRASSGFFTATLTWDGPGDVDLHVLEPSGSHVFFGYPIGTSGFLDVDEVVGFGPEHYYAACDASKLRTGTYAVSLANYQGAEGRKATVQIASNAEGVLATTTVTMGAATEFRPSIQVFNVNVTADTTTGRLRASIGR